MNPKHELKCKEIAELAERFLPLDDFGFQKTEILAKPHASVIYDSEYCRMQLVWGGWDMYSGDTISIYYGRDRTTLDESIIDLNGNMYYSWYDIKPILNFLDGISPKEAVEQLYVHGRSPLVVEQFIQSDQGKRASSYQPEWLMRMHAAIWDHYGQHLFDVFHSRNTQLWNEYLRFETEYKKIKKSRFRFGSAKES